MDRIGHAQWAGRSWRFFPLVLVVTGCVFVVPIIVVWQLRASGTVTSLWVAVAIGVAVSLLVSWLLRIMWTHGPHHSDLLFSELLVWGWLVRLRSERRLASAAEMLGALEPAQAGRSGRAPGISRSARWRLVQELADAVDAQDVYLHGHSRRVAAHAEKIGRRMGLSTAELNRLRAAAAAHDVGKLRLPREVLDKPSRLTEPEFELVKRHPDEGADIVATLGDPEITAIVRHHHERFDGRGYPAGLAGETIPLGARIVAVADTFDAITSVRPYRAAAEHGQAIAALRACSGTQLDPEVVDAFLASYAGRRQALLLAGALAGPQQALVRLGGGQPVSLRAEAANALAVVAASAAVAAAAGLPTMNLQREMASGAHARRASVLAAHAKRSGSAASGRTAGSMGAAASGAGRRGGHPRSRGSHSGAGTGSAPGSGATPRRSSTSTRGVGGSPAPGAPGPIGRPGTPPGPGTVVGTVPPPNRSAPGASPPPAGGPPGRTSAPTATTQPSQSSPTTSQPTSTPTPTSSGPSSGPSSAPPSAPATRPLSAGTTTCDGTYQGSGQEVLVPSGGHCTLLSGTRVSNDVTVQSGGSLTLQSASIGGDLSADGSSALSICGTSIAHDLHIRDVSGGQVTVGNAGGCGPNSIGHDLDVQHNQAYVLVAGNHIGHDMHIQDNSGGVTVSGNSVGHDAQCEKNDPDVAGSGNNAAHEAKGCP